MAHHGGHGSHAPGMGNHLMRNHSMTNHSMINMTMGTGHTATGMGHAGHGGTGQVCNRLVVVRRELLVRR